MVLRNINMEDEWERGCVMATSSITKEFVVKDVEKFISLLEELEKNNADSEYDKDKSELYNSNNREQVTKLLKQLKIEHSDD